jgi:5-methylcytosine-specific restriction endonuclease McrA
MCSRCRQVLPVTSFNKWKRSKDGLSYYCRDCVRTLDRRYSRANSGNTVDYVPATEKTCRQCNSTLPADSFHRSKYVPDGLAIYCKKCKSARARRHYAANGDKVRSRAMRYYLANREELLKQRPGAWKRYKAENQEKILERSRKYREENREACAARVMRWHKANPEAGLAAKHRRRARKRAAGGNHSGAQLRQLYIEQEGKCVYCKCDLNGKYHGDHIISLFKGGSNDISNIQLLCGPCNQRKHVKNHDEFIQYLMD